MQITKTCFSPQMDARSDDGDDSDDDNDDRWKVMAVMIIMMGLVMLMMVKVLALNNHKRIFFMFLP